MKINNIVVTFWFNKVVDIKNKLNVFETELKDYFHGINSIGVPADINPEYPRLSAMSDGGHTKLNISMINLQLMTKFDDLYNNDYSKCFEYIEERALKSFNILTSILNLNVLYGAIIISYERDDINPVSLIKSNLFSNKLNENYYEAGVKTAEIINKKFYRNIIINSAKLVTINKKIEPGQREIIVPLISLADSTVDKESILINYEINDKYSFDTDSNYKLNIENLKEMINNAKNDIDDKILKIINN